MIDGLLIAVQHHRCVKCGRREETSQTHGTTFGEGVEQPRFAVRIPPGWHVFDGKLACSTECAKALVEAP